MIVAMIYYIVHIVRRTYKEKKAIGELTDLLFPHGEEQEQSVIDKIMEITKNRFVREDILDYYLKIKGLHVVDLHTGCESNVREFLMQPTRIRLNYMELVRFYDEFFSFPEARGQSAINEKF